MPHNYFRFIAFFLLMSITVFNCTLKPSPTQLPALSIQEKYPHPLNPLDTNEINSVKQILLAEGKIDSTFLFYLINLNEPPKKEMLRYKNGMEFRREAFASVYHRPTNKTYEAIIDLKTKKTISFNNIPGVTTGIFLQDSIGDALLRKDP